MTTGSRGRSGGRRWRRIAVGVTVLVILLTAGWVLEFSPLFGVRAVAVTGTTTVTVEEVRAVARIAPGTPLARVDLSAVEARVARIPQVRRVTAGRSWPHTVTVVVAERQPLAVVARAGERWLVDQEAVFYLPVTRLRGGVPAGVVPVSLAHPGPQDPATHAAMQVLASLPVSMRTTIRSASASGPDMVTFRLVDGRRVIWGSPADSADKARVLRALLTRPGTLFDVSTPSAALVR